MINRRAFVTGLGTVLVAPLVAEASQQQHNLGQLRRVAVLSGNTARAAAANIAELQRGLQEIGYVDAGDIAIEVRYADGRLERLPALAREIVDLEPDVIVTSGIPAALAVKKATATIPIVVAAAGDLAGNGLVVSDAAPGGNATGIDELSPDTSDSRLTLLREAVPIASPVAVLSSATPSTYAIQRYGTERAAERFGLTLKVFDVRDAAQFEPAFGRMMQEQVKALLVFSGLLTAVNRIKIVALAERHRLAAMYWSETFVQVGGLMSYGPSVPLMFHQSASLVGRVLAGAKVSDLPVQRPTKLQFLINLKNAKALGLTITPSLLRKADQVIE
jgi:putative ABC transport system substrate-binding protein